MKTFKNKRETEKELKHIDVFIDGVYVGYMIFNSVECTQTGKDWHFWSKVPNKIKHGLKAKTKNELIDLIPNTLN